MGKVNYEANEPCIVCGLSGDGRVCYHHLYRQKTYPELKDKHWNKLPVCLAHHNEIHNKPLTEFVKKYYKVWLWLSVNNWSIDKFKQTWEHKKNE